MSSLVSCTVAHKHELMNIAQEAWLSGNMRNEDTSNFANNILENLCLQPRVGFVVRGVRQTRDLLTLHASTPLIFSVPFRRALIEHDDELTRFETLRNLVAFLCRRK